MFGQQINVSVLSAVYLKIMPNDVTLVSYISL